MKSIAEITHFFRREGISFQLLLNGADEQEAVVSTIVHDSREAETGSLFCCLPGTKTDGHNFASKAVAAGACLLLCERSLPLPVPQLVVKTVRHTMGKLAAFIYDYPGNHLRMIAVTGTNGKSTTTYMIRQMLEESGIKTGLLGTIIYSDGKCEVPGDRTTPESTSVQRWLRDMVVNGCQACVMEASSHGLDMGRLEGCLFDHAVFTNLTPEHLDFHGDMERYYHAKKRLFENHMRGEWTMSVNVDDPFGRRLLEEWRSRALPFGLDAADQAQVRGRIRNIALSGTLLDVFLPEGEVIGSLTIPFTGRYNVSNALGAISAGYQLGLNSPTLRQALETLRQVPGRLERIDIGNNAYCIIDYAHSPDALENVLQALKEVTSGKLWAVFGLGGERYEENRPAMGEIAARLADRIIITMDNPRSESPQRIAEQIAAGIESREEHPPYRIILDRAQAVATALNEAESGDAVMIGGKGPETYMIIGNETLHYNDRETVLEWLDRQRRGTLG